MAKSLNIVFPVLVVGNLLCDPLSWCRIFMIGLQITLYSLQKNCPKTVVFKQYMCGIHSRLIPRRVWERG